MPLYLKPTDTDITLPDGAQYRTLGTFEEGDAIQTDKDAPDMTVLPDDLVARLGDPSFYDVDKGECIAPWNTYAAPEPPDDAAYQAEIAAVTERYYGRGDVAAAMVESITTAVTQVSVARGGAVKVGG